VRIGEEEAEEAVKCSIIYVKGGFGTVLEELELEELLTGCL
jgi:hypothetical protein